jgi:hypothetical protein
MGDADDSYDFGELGRFVDKLRAGERFVMGTRLRGTILPGAMPTLNRYLGTPVLTWLLNRLFSTRISDCNCGMRGFDRESVLALGLSARGMEFASEMIIRAALEGLPIAEVPITLHRDKRDHPPHLRPWRDGWRHLRFLLWYAPDQMMTVPGLIALAIGLGLTLSQVAGPFHLGGVLFDIHFMILGLTLSMLGMSALSMGVAVHAMMSARASPGAGGGPRPVRPVRTVRALDRLKSWFDFDRAAALAAVQLAAGIGADGGVLWHWLSTHRGPLGPGYTRLTLVGLLLIATGFQTLLAGLLVGLAHNERDRESADGERAREPVSASHPAAQ